MANGRRGGRQTKATQEKGIPRSPPPQPKRAIYGVGRASEEEGGVSVGELQSDEGSNPILARARGG